MGPQGWTVTVARTVRTSTSRTAWRRCGSGNAADADRLVGSFGQAPSESSRSGRSAAASKDSTVRMRVHQALLKVHGLRASAGHGSGSAVRGMALAPRDAAPDRDVTPEELSMARSKDGFASRRAAEFDALAFDVCGTEDIRREAHTLPQADFAELYERTSTPLVVSGVVEHESWPASTRWRGYDSLLRQNGAAEMRLKCGVDGGMDVKIRLSDFVDYAARNEDDSPLYVFDQGADANFVDICLEAYGVPSFVGEDLFELVDESQRPPYKWWLLGPKRSGTAAHVDPLGTSAWNTVVSGRKRWVLFEPDTPRSVAQGWDYVGDHEDDEPVNFFVDVLPRLRRAHPEVRRIEFVQHPGETVYVPGGWWHAVINLDDSIGITQNYASPANFDKVWDQTRTSRVETANAWLLQLEASPAPEHRLLARRARRRPPSDAPE
ncbi:hypothetical protein M885DRAFT_529567 [Pelagophyceae sp. CCMP2097]|nr:hypothetical protein M885DRAFT_529567 [Pelagophyceae sp. CCMP2097]